jgi:hypothetical protein
MKNSCLNSREYMDYMNDIEYLTWIEKRFGPLTKTVGNNPSNESLREIEYGLIEILHKYKSELKISIPMPKIRMWMKGGKVNFMFFDKHNDRRVLLGDWLSNKVIYYEH